MNRDVLKLQRDIINGPGKGCSPFDRYSYNAFAWSAQHLSYRVKTEEERELCMFLKEIAIRKSKALLAQEMAAKEALDQMDQLGQSPPIQCNEA